MTRKAPPTAEQVRLIKANIHPPAQAAIGDWATFSWHRDRSGAPDTHLPHSSQAFCISVWGTLTRPDAERGVVASLLDDEVLADALHGAPELRLEYTDRAVLNERGAGIPTNIDALFLYPAVAVVIESKLTEGFGSCSQVGRGYCTGIYEVGSDLKTGTRAPCRLQLQDGRRTPRLYWDVMQGLSEPDTYRPGGPCPFAGPGYQVMRNVAFAARLASRIRSDWRVIFAFPASLSPESSADVDRIASLLRPDIRRRVLQLDYGDLVTSLEGAFDEVSVGLSRYMRDRLG